MKILYITRIVPYPQDSGGVIKTHSTLTLLSKLHQIDLVCFYRDKETFKKAKSFYSKLGIRLFGIYSAKPLVGFRQSKLTLIKNILLLRPALFTSVYSGKLHKLIDNLERTNYYEGVQIDHLAIAQYLPADKNVTKVYEEHNIEYALAWEQFLATHKLFFFFESIFLYFYEKVYVKKFDKIVSISKADRLALKKFGVDKEIIVLPPITRSRYVRPKKLSHTLLFIGNLYWYPNIHALQWFCEKVLIHLPNVTLDIVGDISDHSKQLFSKYSNCRIHGFIPDLDKFLDGNEYIFIMPFTIAQGVRLKALDAMSRGYPIVATKKAMLGLEVKENKEYLRAETPEEFVRKIKLLVSNRSLKNKLKNNAVDYLKKHHSEEQGLRTVSKLFG